MIGVDLHLKLSLRRLFGLSEYHLFPYRPSLMFQAQVPSTLYVRVWNHQFKLIRACISARSKGFCAIWVCSSSSLSSIQPYTIGAC